MVFCKRAIQSPSGTSTRPRLWNRVSPGSARLYTWPPLRTESFLLTALVVGCSPAPRARPGIAGTTRGGGCMYVCVCVSPRLCPSQHPDGSPRRAKGSHRVWAASMPGRGQRGPVRAELNPVAQVGRGDPGIAVFLGAAVTTSTKAGFEPCSYSPVSSMSPDSAHATAAWSRRWVSAAWRGGSRGHWRSSGSRGVSSLSLAIGGPPGSRVSRRGLMSSGCQNSGTDGEGCGAGEPLGSARRLSRGSEQCEGPRVNIYVCVCAFVNVFVCVHIYAYIHIRVMYMQNIYNVYV